MAALPSKNNEVEATAGVQISSRVAKLDALSTKSLASVQEPLDAQLY
jgi:hypothetical protein